MIETINGNTSAAKQGPQQGQDIYEKIFAAAQPTAVYASPVVAGDYTVITASEVFAGGGFGFGSGSGPTQATPVNASAGQDQQTIGASGGGGGGGSHGRPVAAIVIGPDGVKIRPIVDPTKIALAALGAWASIVLMATRFARTKRRA